MVTHQLVLSSELDWLLDDTEEALLGTSVHQYTIVNLYSDLSRLKRRAGLPWFIGNQLKLIIRRRGDLPPYHPSPDILIHPTLGDAELTSLSIGKHGPPVVIIEVASPGTAYQHDLDAVDPQGKPLAYAQAGIPEYLVFDPTGNIIPERIRAWRGGPEGYGEWLPDPATGRWHSALGISFAPQGVLLRVYDTDGNLIPTQQELDTILDTQTSELEALRTEVRRLRGE
jgi:Uma2 family endonuclease